MATAALKDKRRHAAVTTHTVRDHVVGRHRSPVAHRHTRTSAVGDVDPVDVARQPHFSAAVLDGLDKRSDDRLRAALGVVQAGSVAVQVGDGVGDGATEGLRSRHGRQRERERVQPRLQPRVRDPPRLRQSPLDDLVERTLQLVHACACFQERREVRQERGQCGVVGAEGVERDRHRNVVQPVRVLPQRLPLGNRSRTAKPSNLAVELGGTAVHGGAALEWPRSLGGHHAPSAVRNPLDVALEVHEEDLESVVRRTARARVDRRPAVELEPLALEGVRAAAGRVVRLEDEDALPVRCGHRAGAKAADAGADHQHLGIGDGGGAADAATPEPRRRHAERGSRADGEGRDEAAGEHGRGAHGAVQQLRLWC